MIYTALEKNVIPRSFKYLVGIMKVDTNATKKGECVKAWKDNTGYYMANASGKIFQCFVSMLRNKDVIDILYIIK